MSEISRDELRFEVLRLFALHALQKRTALNDPSAMEEFEVAVHSSLDAALKQDHLLQGLRTEAMFRSLVIALGAIELIKYEDAGPVYFGHDTVKVPDFRVVLSDGSQMLIEVKNLYLRNQLSRPFRLRADYLDELVRYANLVNCPLRLAIFWAGLDVWTLIPVESLRGTGRYRQVTFAQSMYPNEMVILGDRLIGTKFPLVIRSFADQSKAQKIREDGSFGFTADRLELDCAGSEITDPTEQKIAWYLIRHGKWDTDGPQQEIRAGQLLHVQLSFMPQEDFGQGFAMVGYLSEMFARSYLEATTDESGEIVQLLRKAHPGALGSLIPEHYSGDALPLWIFLQQPSQGNGC
jgi:hypothetical protein